MILNLEQRRVKIKINKHILRSMGWEEHENSRVDVENVVGAVLPGCAETWRG